MKNHFLEASAAWDNGTHYAAYRLFLAGAKAGDADCMNLLGYFYDNGIGIKSNPDRAEYWYKQSCKAGRNPLAANNLGILYLHLGKAKTAAQYFSRAVNWGYPEAQLDLAKLHLREGHVAKAESCLRDLLLLNKKTIFPDVRASALRLQRKLGANRQ